MIESVKPAEGFQPIRERRLGGFLRAGIARQHPDHAGRDGIQRAAGVLRALWIAPDGYHCRALGHHRAGRGKPEARGATDDDNPLSR